MLQMMTRFRASSDSRAHAVVSHDALGGLADGHRAAPRPLSTRKRTATRRLLRIQLDRDSFGAHAFIAHDALGGLPDVHRINSRNV